MGFGDEADVRPVAAFGKGGESSSRGELSSDRDGFSGGRRGFGEPTRNYEGSKLNERRGNGPFGNRFSEHCDRDRPPQFGFSNFDDRRERVNNFGKNHTESGNRRKNDNDITDDWDSAAAPRFNTRQYNNRSESRRCQGNDSDRGRDFGDSRTRNFGQTDHGFNSGGRYNNERASVREKNFGFRNEGSPFGGFNGRDKSDRDRYPTRDDRGEFKENTRGFSRAAEDSRSFGRDARDFSGPGSRESAYRKADAPQGMNTTFGGFNRGGFGVRSNPRQESFYGSSGGFRSDDYDYDRGDHGGQQVFTRSRRQWSPDESKGMKRNSSPEHFGRNSSRIGVFKPREDFRQDSGYNQEKDVWGSNGERTFKRRSEFGRSSNLEGNTPRFGAQVANGSSEKERAPKEWEPEETELDTLFQRDFSNSEHLDKEHEESVIVEGVEDFTRISSWENSGLNPKLVKTCVELCNYKYLRPIQAVTIP
ncbi:hypothetical protein KIN20_034323 [Parelaphostrongylus tenuis]|uniref:DEAD-box RNA helicase Q domain-containing protein n=1 Tax=Parelaphostrongylus tenuis TaxID=148309 RepID=A0AAD5RA63_PARTN|nr:hypothetical protein KIN20_034323 [Parelaphostrongylus tenuis]